MMESLPDAGSQGARGIVISSRPIRMISMIRMIRMEPRPKGRMEMRSSKLPIRALAMELIRMNRTEPRQKPRMEIIQKVMDL